MRKRGFTLIELLVVIAVIGLLAGIILVAVNSSRVKARDAKRISDFYQLQVALELYIDEYREPPMPDDYGEPNTWDTSYDGDFMQFLEGTAGTANPRDIQFMSAVPLDPINSGAIGDCIATLDNYYHYCYFYYPWPTWDYDDNHYQLYTKLEQTDEVYGVAGIVK